MLLSGEATFAGYIRLDDTASWLALAERAMEQGSNVSGLAPSTYEATLDFYLNSDYPLGGLVPLGVGGDLVGQDYAWVWQPYQSFLGAMLALGLYALLAELPVRPALRALIAVLAAQPALVVGYALWGGFKEVAAAALVVLVAALGARVAVEGLSGRRLLPLAVASAGVLAVLSAGGGIWLVPALLPVLIAVFRRSPKDAARQSLWLGGVVVALTAPTLLAVGFFGAPAASTITDQERLANLIEPLSPLQIFGIWPAGDFRLRPDELAAADLLIAIAAVAVLLGAIWMWRNRKWTLLLYGVGAVGGAAVIFSLGSPWVDAKALAVASPALVLAALVGVFFAYTTGRRVEAVALAAAVIGGVAWSNVFAYHAVNLAPRERMEELEQIGHRIAGQGPTLMTEYEPVGARYFLRDSDPESASELRRRQVRLRDGGTVPKGSYADIDQFALPEVLVYRTLVLRRSPTISRPPAAYRLIWSGRYYDVWQRPPGTVDATVEHVPLGDELRRSAVPPCDTIRRLMRESPPGSRLAGVPRSPATIVDLAEANRPGSWEAVAGGWERCDRSRPEPRRPVSPSRARAGTTSGWEERHAERPPSRSPAGGWARCGTASAIRRGTYSLGRSIFPWVNRRRPCITAPATCIPAAVASPR